MSKTIMVEIEVYWKEEGPDLKELLGEDVEETLEPGRMVIDLLSISRINHNKPEMTTFDLFGYTYGAKMSYEEFKSMYTKYTGIKIFKPQG